MSRTYDPAPLFTAAERREMTVKALAARIGCSRALLARWRRDGAVPERWADAAAVAVGRLPGELWPEWTEAAIAEVDAKDAERRAKDAERKRRWRADNPERDRARVEAWKAANRERHYRYQADYKERNRARLNAYRRERYAQERALRSEAS